jgi:hypothetical protein
VLSDVLFPHGYEEHDNEFVIEFEPDAIVYDAIESAENAKPVLTLVPEKK